MTQNKVKTAFAFIFMAASFWFAFFGLSRPFWPVECCTVEIADTSWSGILENLKTNAHSPPLYYFLLKLWMGLWGTGEAATRGLSSMFYLFSIAAVLFLGKTLYDQKTALLCAFLLMVNPMAVQFAQFARMYSLLSFLGILSTFFFLRQFFTGGASKRNLAAYMAVNAAGTFTHYWFFFLLLAQGAACLLWFPKSALKSFLLAMAASVAPFFLLWTPVLRIQMTNGGTSEFNRPGFFTLPNTLLFFWGGGKKAALVYVAFFTLALVGLSGLKIKFRSVMELKPFLFEKKTLTLLTLLLVSLIVPWAISQFYPLYEETKYPIVVLFAAIMFIGSLLAQFGDRFLVMLFCSALFLAAGLGFIRGRTHPPTDSPRAVTAYLLEQAAPKDVVIFVTNGWGPAAYYMRRAGAMDRFTPFVFPAEQAKHPCWTNPGKWLNAQALLETEAGELVDRVDSLLGAGGGNIWLLSGWLPEINDIMKNCLDRRFQVLEEKNLGESYLPLRDKIRGYRRRETLLPGG